MKIRILYYLLGIMIISTVKITDEDNTAMDHCATTNDNTVLCYKNDKNVIPVIPDDIPSNVMRFILRSEHSSIPWLIHSTETFRKFSHLQSLFIRSSVQFSPEFQKSDSKEILSESLFDLPELINFTLYNCSFEGIRDVTWTLPQNLERFYLQNSTVGDFNLKNCPKLQELVIEFGNLTKMPELYFPPPPPLHTMNLRGNPHLRLNVNEVAFLCNLSRISFDVVGTHLGSSDGYCECNELKNWYQWLVDMNATVNFDISPEWRCSSEERDCQTDSLDKAKEIYKEICLDEIPQEAIGTFRLIIGLWAYIIPMILILFFITVALIMYALSKGKSKPNSRVEATESIEAIEEQISEEVEEEHHRES